MRDHLQGTSPQFERDSDAIVALLSAIIDSSDDAIVSKTLDGIVTSWNRAAERMFGYTAAEAIGRSITLIIPPELRSEEDYVLGEIRRGNRVDHFETVRQTKDGRRIDISLTVSPIKNAQGVVVGASKIACDITDRKRLESLLSAFVNNSDDHIVTTNLESVITSWNGGAEKMFGYSASEAIGQSIRLIIPPELQAEEDHVLDQIRRGKRVDHYETVRQTKDGRRLNISLTVSPIRDARGGVVGASKVARDITAKKQWESEREELLTRQRIARQQLAEALTARDEFIAVAAHELRNPLNVVTMMMQMLRHMSVDFPNLEPVWKTVEKLRTQIGRLSALVERLMDVTRIRTGSFDLYRDSFDLGGLIREIANRFAIEHPTVPISVELESNIEGNWDRLRMDQAITNLISNAVRYGIKKPIVVSASITGDYAVVRVRDNGTGIPPQDLNRIFDRFERSTEHSASKGLGLGLWITKQIVEAHRGTVLAESELGKGSTFVLQLPRRA